MRNFALRIAGHEPPMTTCFRLHLPISGSGRQKINKTTRIADYVDDRNHNFFRQVKWYKLDGRISYRQYPPQTRQHFTQLLTTP